jgi:hypothetical protein
MEDGVEMKPEEAHFTEIKELGEHYLMLARSLPSLLARGGWGPPGPVASLFLSALGPHPQRFSLRDSLRYH